ncbi:MAG: ribosome maturation factor RimM [Cyanobacteria bacterium CAN_BIN43]|nr:ribosome maturation factor RimM [Cyanobacteria bacterium CAN_BIN43]
MDDWLKIGKIVAAQGLKGEMRVYPDSDFPQRFEQPGERWLLRPGATEPEKIQLVSGRSLAGKGLYVLRFVGVNSREQAEALRDCHLVVKESDRPPLEEGEFHVMDLIGLEVFDQVTQARVGTVTDVFAAGNDLLEIALTHLEGNPKVLVPFVEAIVPIVDLTGRRIEITPPAGLIPAPVEPEQPIEAEKVSQIDKGSALK